ncbi:Cut8 six-helix bundle-domain-containing protein [Peziza echinospora]|nr:Cut8 six-helix bundle-domain-containing protein [Peziza echinospora]
MSTLLNPQPFVFPSQHTPQHMPSRPSPAKMAGRKRKAADTDGDSAMGRDRSRSPEENDADEQMNASPAHSPSLESRILIKGTKRQRNTVTGRPLPLNRVLETVDSSALKSILRELCNRHPQLESEIFSIAPRPSPASAITILNNYESNLRAAFPYGGNPEGDYSYYRVKAALIELLDGLSDYTPHFLPPNETHAANSLAFLDGATEIIHRLPNWSTPMHNHHKQTAYEEITKAWVLVIKEASKRGAGITLQHGSWDTKLSRHNEQSGGRMGTAVMEMKNSLPGGTDMNRPRFGGVGFPMQTGGLSLRSW